MSYVILKELTCALSGDPVKVPVRIDQPIDTYISEHSLRAAAYLYLNGDLDWIKIAYIEAPGDLSLKLMIRSDSTELNALLEKHGYEVRHGDRYQTDKVQFGQPVDNEDTEHTIAGVLHRLSYRGETEAITREHLNHPTFQNWVSSHEEELEQLRDKYADELSRPIIISKQAHEEQPGPNSNGSSDSPGCTGEGTDDHCGIEGD